MIKITLILIFLWQMPAFAASHQKIDTLGMSPKGQFVAMEEYGYQPDKHSYFVTIRIINVWTKEFVGQTIQVELPVSRKTFLLDARKKAKDLAQEILKTYNIVSG